MIDDLMDGFRAFMESDDVCSLSFVVLLLLVIGSRMVERRRALQNWGLRLATGTFVAYAIYRIAMGSTIEPGDVALLLLRALLVAGLMLGVSWIVLPMAAFVLDGLARPALSIAKSLLRRACTGRTTTQAELLHLRTALDAKSAELAAAEQRRNEAQHAALVDREAQRRRDDARASCELLFAQFAPEIEKRFPRIAFDQFMAKYLGDDRSPEEVQQRAAQLCDMLRQQRQSLDPARRFTNLTELSAWYEEQQRHVRAAGLDPTTEETLLINLEIQHEELIRRFILET